MTSKPLEKFNKMLSKYKVTGTADSNYTSMNPPGKYYIPDGKKYKKFIKAYSKALSMGFGFHITQKHKYYSYFILDLDFKFPKRLGTQRVYHVYYVKKIVALCNRVLLQYLKIKDKHLLAFVMEKRKPHVRKDFSCDGIHIVYPYVGFHTNAHYLVINDIVNLAIQEELFKGLPFCNPITKVFDTDVVYRANWMLYGSCKPDGSPYYLTYILDRKLNKINFGKITWGDLPNEEGFEDNELLMLQDLPLLLNIRKFANDGSDATPYVKNLDQDIVDKKLAELKKKENVKKNIVVLDKKIAKKKEESDLKNYNNKPSLHVVTKGTLKDIVRAQKLVEIIHDERANVYKDWIDVGIALHSIDYSLLDTWIEFSKKCMGKFKPGECENLWEKFDKYSGSGIGALFVWAREDNPDAYKKFRRNEIKEYILTGLSGHKFDLAAVVHGLYKNEFVCASIEKKDWYQFSNHKWIKVEEGYSLDYLLSTAVYEEFANLASYYYGMCSKNKTKASDKNQFDEKGKKATRVMAMLKDTTHKDKIMKECKKLFFDPDFYKKVDENKDLLGVKNGVIDLKTGEFRSGLPEDYITLSTNTKYIPYNPNDPKFIWVRNFLKQIQPKKEIRDYVTRLLSTCLSGHNPKEQFYLLTGTGCFLKDTKVMMYDGSSKYVQNVKPHDFIMGHDSTKKEVLCTFRNNSEMFKITPITKCGLELPHYTVNGEHNLVLKAQQDAIIIKPDKIIWWDAKLIRHECNLKDSKDITPVKKGDDVIITVNNWLKSTSMCSWLNTIFFGYRNPVMMEDCDDLFVDPYLLGVWLILGSPYRKTLIGVNSVVKRKLEKKQLWKNDKLSNKAIKNMDKLGLFNSLIAKKIPVRYLYSSICTRNLIIKGIKDCGIHIYSNEELVNEVCKLFVSVGKIAAYTKIKNRESAWMLKELENEACTQLKIRSIGNANYYGFELASSDSRFLLEDCTVVSNSNGKSKLIALFQYACGEYCDTIPVSFFTRKRNSSSAASPEIAKTKGKRFCVMQEPEIEDKLNEGLVKEMTGNDEIEARKLFKEPIKFRPQYKLMLVCNTKPTIASLDGGTWRRIMTIDFKSKFVKNPDPNKPYQFKKDELLNEKLPLYAEAFLSILVHEHVLYRKHGLEEPEEVTTSTEEYKMKNDIWRTFINEKLTEVKGGELSFKLLFSQFRMWLKQGNTTKNSNLSINDMKDYFTKNEYKVVKDKLIGYTLSKEEDEVQDDDDD